MKFINKYKSSNFDNRINKNKPSIIILHYTAMSSNIEAIKYMLNKENKVSSHFLISKYGSIYQLVDLKHRAWHAGLSSWKNIKDVNSHSIGIELDNLGQARKLYRFEAKQVNALIKLVDYLKKKFSITNEKILGHSDIAPYRKIDPGKNFPWDKLLKKDIGFLPKKIINSDLVLLEKYFKKYKFLNSKKKKALFMLEAIGYNIMPAKNNSRNFFLLIKSYQQHFIRNNANGKLDSLTYSKIQYHFKQILTK